MSIEDSGKFPKKYGETVKMRASIIIPTVLSHRIDLFKALDAAYVLLDTIKKSNVNAGSEIQFVQDRIGKIEADLEDTQAEAEQIINLMQDDVILWTIARLRFLQGYEWKQASDVVGLTSDSGRMRVYRFFRAMKHLPKCESGREAAKAGKRG